MKSLSAFPIAVLLVLSCSGRGQRAEIPVATYEPEAKSLTAGITSPGMSLAIVDNPAPSAVNGTAKCVRVASDTGRVVLSPFGRNFDFTLNPAVFPLKVIAPGKGLPVTMRLMPFLEDSPYPPLGVTVNTRRSGRWEQLLFDFSGLHPEDNVYAGFELQFAEGEWWFDELYGPDDDLSSIALFKRYEGNPVFYPEGELNWRDAHIANAGILNPSQNPTGQWMMYIRGTGHTPDYHDQIGLFTQPADDFHPFGPWKEYEGNPVIPFSPKGAFDDYLLLDTAPVMGKDSVMYVYYKGRNYEMESHIGVAWSTDGGYTFSKPGHPWLDQHSGTGSAIYHDGKYWLFSGSRVYVSEDPLNGNDAEVYQTIVPGGAPSHFDDNVLWGTMVFRLEGVDKWFMAYQGSARHPDFPDRFHIAVSDDLIHWTKVQNSQPLFTRGSEGEWDQGGMWCPEIEEYDGMLYLYYEGWGIDKKIADRNQNYFEGHSSVGVASASKDAFLRWCGLME